ncbi:hypothetical protein K1X76_09465 [bacterium]|nr:hypothetical protein [bacterium]
MSIRFAPSPTGIFHIGNLRTAFIAQLLAKQLQQPLVMRFEDIDTPRVIPGAMDKQLADMKVLGIVPDEIIVQSKNRERHLSVFEHFKKEKLIYPCTCSRKTVQQGLEQIASAPHETPAIYNGHCRNLNQDTQERENLNWRFKMPNETGQDDFIIARDNPFVPAYHLACAVDDYDGNYSLLVRAWDLEKVTPLQQAIQMSLAKLENKQFSPATIYHTSLITQNDRHRLEKRTQGVTLDELLKQGYTAKKIIEIFEKSIKAKLEEKKTLTLNELGFYL